MLKNVHIYNVHISYSVISTSKKLVKWYNINYTQSYILTNIHYIVSYNTTKFKTNI